MFVAAIKRVENALFPIFRRVVRDPTTEWAVVGSGFFIDNKGVFASVAHIFDDAPAGADFVYLGRLPKDLHNTPLVITELARDDSRDVFIGKVDLKPTGMMPLTPGMPDVGRSVCLMGHPLAILQANTAGGLEVGGVRAYPQPSFVLDHVMAASEKNRVHDGFLVRDIGLPGMSGCPVFDTSGWALGMQAAVLSRQCVTAAGRKLVVDNALVIRAAHIQRIYDALRQRKSPPMRKAS
jgi:hypothetical protein